MHPKSRNRLVLDKHSQNSSYRYWNGQYSNGTLVRWEWRWLPPWCLWSKVGENPVDTWKSLRTVLRHNGLCNTQEYINGYHRFLLPQIPNLSMFKTSVNVSWKEVNKTRREEPKATNIPSAKQEYSFKYLGPSCYNYPFLLWVITKNYHQRPLTLNYSPKKKLGWNKEPREFVSQIPRKGGNRCRNLTDAINQKKERLLKPPGQTSSWLPLGKASKENRPDTASWPFLKWVCGFTLGCYTPLKLHRHSGKNTTLSGHWCTSLPAGLVNQTACLLNSIQVMYFKLWSRVVSTNRASFRYPPVPQVPSQSGIPPTNLPLASLAPPPHKKKEEKNSVDEHATPELHAQL